MHFPVFDYFAMYFFNGLILIIHTASLMTFGRKHYAGSFDFVVKYESLTRGGWDKINNLLNNNLYGNISLHPTEEGS